MLMKKTIKIVGGILILAIIICGIVFAVNNKEQSEEGKESSKEHTFNSNNEIKTALTLKDEIQNNTIWCGTFQLIWNDLKNDLAKQDITFTPQKQIVKNLNEEMTFGTFMMIVRSQYNPYLSWFFKSTDFRNQIKGGGNTMINQITRYMLDDVVISFPPIEKQNEVVQKLNALHLETKKLEAIYQQKINDLEELKKSVLQKAFAGELKENLKEHYAENA